MKLFQTSPKKSADTRHDVQQAPARISPATDTPNELIKVDVCVVGAKQLLVVGWHTSPLTLELLANDSSVTTVETKVERPDVNKHFNIPASVPCGFIIRAALKGDEDPNDQFQLQWMTKEGLIQKSQPLQVKTKSEMTDAERSAAGPALLMDTRDLPLNSQEWCDVVAKLPTTNAACLTARGFLEAAAVCDETKGAVVVGWVVQKPGTRVWLEDANGHAFSLDSAFKQFRQDVYDVVANDFAHGGREAGFVLRIQGLKAGTLLRLKAMNDAGIHTLSETNSTTLPLDPVAAARWLFAVRTPLSQLHRRIPMVDEAVLAPLMEKRQDLWNDLPKEHRQVGRLPCKAEVSIIIPLYGRVDFVEHQLIEFAKDAWLSSCAEIIYVLDDPKLVEEFKTLAQTLHQLYRVPFQWIWGQVNRGFSGANNLGAEAATGKHLVFLNSDAFPQSPGWVQELVNALDQNPDLGAIGPRLVFGDGGIQHAGMEFQRRDDLGIWVNHHPRMGLDPSLDPHTSLSRVTAITGACMVVRREDFDAIHGWDSGYLIGDFEDSDLCNKLRARGMGIGYLPTVQLTHLERQSFKLLGQDEFRQRVVLYNAVRHQTRWAHLLNEHGTTSPTA